MVSNIIFEILDVNHVCDGLSLIKHMRRMRWDLRCNVNETCIVDDSWPLCPYGYTGTWASLLMMIQTFGPAYDACMSCDDGMNVWAYHGMAWHGNAGKSPSCHSMGGGVGGSGREGRLPVVGRPMGRCPHPPQCNQSRRWPSCHRHRHSHHAPSHCTLLSHPSCIYTHRQEQNKQKLAIINRSSKWSPWYPTCGLFPPPVGDQMIKISLFMLLFSFKFWDRQTAEQSVSSHIFWYLSICLLSYETC